MLTCLTRVNTLKLMTINIRQDHCDNEIYCNWLLSSLLVYLFWIINSIIYIYFDKIRNAKDNYLWPKGRTPLVSHKSYLSCTRNSWQMDYLDNLIKREYFVQYTHNKLIIFSSIFADIWYIMTVVLCSLE